MIIRLKFSLKEAVQRGGLEHKNPSVSIYYKINYVSSREIGNTAIFLSMSP